MASLQEISILDLPDEVIESIMSCLSHTDLFNLSVSIKRFHCAKRVARNKPFKIAIIGGSNYVGVVTGGLLDDVEVISITKDSISHKWTTKFNSHIKHQLIPSLPKKLSALRGTQLSNGDLVLSGGYTKSGYDYVDSDGLYTREHWIVVDDCNDEYLHYKQGSNRWTKVGTMKTARRHHSSVWIDGCLLTTGGESGEWKRIAHHEEFSLNGGVTERKEMPIALKFHTATKFGHHKMIICGGVGFSGKSQLSFIYDLKDNSWTEGPPLLQARFNHSSCAIKSDDGSIRSIIIIGGITDRQYNAYGNNEHITKTTEILDMKEQRWVKGPNIPLGTHVASCVALPPTLEYACLLIGGRTEKYKNENLAEYEYWKNVYGLRKSLDEWTLLGKIKEGRFSHIALPFS